MGLLSKSKTRSLLFYPRYVYPLAAFISLSLFLLFQVHSYVSRTKTIAGHNLEPTPWQIFPDKEKSNFETGYTKASKVIQCSYFKCGSGNRFPIQSKLSMSSNHAEKCPDFYRWIHHDLEPWHKTRISMAHLMAAKNTAAAFRVVIIDGRLYVDSYYGCVQSRSLFTVWGFVQLLRRYPGHVPDVDLMFDCMDKPVINRTEHALWPFPLFRYCTSAEHYDIPFPDWSFWGWKEVNISPWDEEFKSIKRGANSKSWKKKIPHAYWKGNPDVVSPIRLALLECNDTELWGARIVRQNWTEEKKHGFAKSKLSNQCKNRYKIYAEGYAWSVSLKYILSCGSVPLLIHPEYEDFFSRGLFPKKNYWPISPSNLCPSIKFAVEWGNRHIRQAEAMGKAAQDLMESISMDGVYDYMFHLISEYSKLLDFKPVRPPTALEVCYDSLLCYADEKKRSFLERSTAFPSLNPPCALPPRDNNVIRSWMEKKSKIIQETEVIPPKPDEQQPTRRIV
ncbi:hypothetical protein AgCh_039126 [Apium graveolens]